MRTSEATPGQSSDSSLDAAQFDSTQYQCRWESCRSLFGRAGQLNVHICNAHIGKRSDSNICLTCKWKDCGKSFEKRDDITKHCRITHVSRSVLQIEPHVCEVCGRLPQHLPRVNMHTSSLYRCVIESSHKSPLSKCTSRTSTN